MIPAVAPLCLALLSTLSGGQELAESARIDLGSSTVVMVSPDAFCQDEFRGVFCVVDGDADQVVIVDEQGAVRKVIRFGEGDWHPIATTVSREGTLYVAGRDTDELRIIHDYDQPNGQDVESTWLRIPDDDHELRPVALEINDRGELLVVDIAGNQVVVFDGEGEFIRRWTHVGQPADLALAPNGVFVADRGAGGVRVLSRDGRMFSTLGVDPEKHEVPIYALSLAVDLRGQVWILDETGALMVVDTNDQVRFSLPVGTFVEPVAIRVDSRGRVSILDRGARELVIYDSLANGIRSSADSGW